MNLFASSVVPESVRKTEWEMMFRRKIKKSTLMIHNTMNQAMYFLIEEVQTVGSRLQIMLDCEGEEFGFRQNFHKFKVSCDFLTWCKA